MRQIIQNVGAENFLGNDTICNYVEHTQDFRSEKILPSPSSFLFSRTHQSHHLLFPWYGLSQRNFSSHSATVILQHVYLFVKNPRRQPWSNTNKVIQAPRLRLRLQGILHCFVPLVHKQVHLLRMLDLSTRSSYSPMTLTRLSSLFLPDNSYCWLVQMLSFCFELLNSKAS